MSDRRWIDPPLITTPDAFLAACGGDGLLASILWRRGYHSPDQVAGFLSAEQYAPAAPESLPDLVLGSTLLQTALATQQRILIWGDFDVDGQTSTALLVDGLTRLGGVVSYYVPKRATESHGMPLASLQRELPKHHPAVILTCDTGIAEHASIAYAREVGLTVIVTDHHELSETLPPAHAVINPHRLPAAHPLSGLPGVGVAFKLMQHLYTSLNRERELAALLDLVALGIVGDVAAQTGDTRYLLQRGLEQLGRTGRIGLQALLSVAKVPLDHVSAEHIGFQIAPRLNAAGRLAEADLSIELLTTHDRSRAAILAQQLEGLNAERRQQTRQIEAAAEAMLAEHPDLLGHAALVLYYPTWPAGLVGIVANSLAERYSKPVVLLCGADAGLARGSARAPHGYDIFAALTANASLLHAFGGHTGAAGMSLPVVKIDAFRRALSHTLATTQGVPDIAPLVIDAYVPLDALTLDLAARIGRLAPFGQGNPAIVVAVADVSLSHSTSIGRERLHRKLTVESATGSRQSILWWGSSHEPLPKDRFDVAVSIGVSAQREVELTLIAWRERATDQPINAPPARQVTDWRLETLPLTQVERLLTEDPQINSQTSVETSPQITSQTLVWAEGFARTEFPHWKRRAELSPAATLIILTIPPDHGVLRAVLDQVQPTTVHLFSMEPPFPTATAVLQQLYTAVKNVIDHHHGVIPMDVLCGAAGQSSAVVEAALALIRAQERIGEYSVGREQVRIDAAGAVRPAIDSAAVAAATDRFNRAYNEVQAYRRFFRTMPLAALG